MSEVDTTQIPNPLAGISTPPPAPNADALSGNQADRFSTAAQTLQQPTTQQTAPAPPAPAPNKHEILGRLVSHIKHAVEGTQVQYVPDPQTGTVQETTVPRRPGGIFRDLVSSMLSGMAASAMAGNANPSGAAGLALGFTGARADQQAQQDRARTQAQNSATSGFQRKQVLDQETLQSATVAKDMLNGLQIGHFIGKHSDSEVSDYNNSVTAVKNVLMDNGGQLAQVEGNSQKGNGPSLMAAYNRDNSLMVAPDGYHRVASITYDTNGLQHDAASHKWVNTDGSQLSDDEWNKRATVSLIDLPNAAWGKSVSLPGSVIQNVAPNTNLVRDPKKSYSTSVGSLFALGLKNKQQMIDARKELYRVPKDANEISQWDQQRQDIQARMQSDPQSVTDDEKRFLAVKGPIIDRAKQLQAAAPVTVNNLNDARSMLDSDKPQEVSAAKNFFLSSLSGPDGDKMAAFVAADPHFLPAERKIAKDWAKSYAAIKATERPEKPEKPEKPADMVIGSIGGKPVAVPFDESSNYKWDAGGRPTKAGAAEAEKVTNARSLISVFDDNDADDPGLLQLAAKLDQKGKLGPVMTRFQQWLNKGNSAANFNAGDPDVQRLFTKMGLSTTGLMQVHVGARGSAQMLEHFEDLAKAKEMSSSAFRTALDTEARYVRMKAMLPSTQRTTQTAALPQAAARVVPAGAIPGRDANGNIVGYRTADGKVVKF